MIYQELRKKFINFFTSPPRNHKEIPSSPLIPENDPTVLFITAGMHPLVSYLLGESHPLGKRLVDIQKCLRTDDIEEVGDLSHFTFFEMLGNWSLGDYFKKEAINWSFEFLTDNQWLGLDPNRIYVSVFEGDSDASKDNESIKIWMEVFRKKNIIAEVGDYKKGLFGNKRIFPYPKNKNWWGPAGQTGPCGPDSEMFFDTQLPLHNEKIHGKLCHINCDCGRFVEIWNDVFMEFNKMSDKSYQSLKQKNVDTGMGMERMVALLEWLDNNIAEPDPFLTTLFKDAVDFIENISRKKYEAQYKKPIRIICDHIRAATFMIADGVFPSNKERGYVLRKLIRRAVRSAYQLEINNTFLSDLSQVIINIYQKYYPELQKNSQIIKQQLTSEENKFRSILLNGMNELKKIKILNGKIAFNLYQSFGFPWEITYEIAKERGQIISKSSFIKEFNKHQELSRSATKGIFKGGLQDYSEQTTKLHTATHLLQQAIIDVLGKNARQSGSHITASRLRFDFTYQNKINLEQLKQIEEIVNQQIKKNLPITRKILTYTEAVSLGALTIPGIKYPKKVKVYFIGDYSKEVCGGPHVDFTGKLGSFKIIKEEAASSNSRRIYAILQ